MKRKFIFTVAILLICLVVPHPLASASSGALRKNSIVTCNGTTYGQHSSNGALHWHVAVQAGNGWNASGDPIYSNPCTSTSNSSTQSSGSASSYSQGSTTYTAPTSSATSTVAPKSNDTSLATLSVNGQNVEISETMTVTIASGSTTIKATPTDSKATAKIIGALEATIEEGETVQATVQITAEDGSTQDYQLNISRKCSPIDFELYVSDERVDFVFSDIYTKNVGYDANTLDFTFTASNSEKIKFYKDDVEVISGSSVDVGSNEYSIAVTNACQETERYSIVINRSDRANSLESFVYGFLGLGLIGAGIYTYLRYGEKIKAKIKPSSKEVRKKKSSSKNGKTKK